MLTLCVYGCVGVWAYARTEGSSTVINTSKEMMAFSDFLVPKEFPPFMHHTQVCVCMCICVRVCVYMCVLVCVCKCLWVFVGGWVGGRHGG
jgi:hypothetical protein